MKNIPSRIVTGLLAFGILASGVFDLMAGKEIVEGMAALGYPKYFLFIIGVWKVLGALALVVPGFERVKEWAYAGIMFDLTGAAISHIVTGQGSPVAPLVMAGLTVVSYVLRARTAPALPVGQTVGVRA